MKRKRQYKDFGSPKEYLCHVLNTWTEFCYVNCGLAQAISDLINEYTSCERDIEALVQRINELEKRNDR